MSPGLWLRALSSLLVLLVVGCPGGAPDFDGDGASDATDCEPADPDIYPGAPDVIGDGIDSSCDGCDGPCNDGGIPLGSNEGAPALPTGLCAAPTVSSNSAYSAVTCTGPAAAPQGRMSSSSYTVLIGSTRFITESP